LLRTILVFYIILNFSPSQPPETVIVTPSIGKPASTDFPIQP